MAKVFVLTAVAVAAAIALVLAPRSPQPERAARADQIGDVTWAMSVDPAEPQVGDTVRVTITPCCFRGSPFMGQTLTVTQDDPPVLEEVSKESYYGSTVTMKALKAGTAQIQLGGAWEKWSCYQPPATATPGTTPTPYPTMCASNFFYTRSPAYTVTVSGAPTPTPPLFFSGDVDCDGVVSTLDALLLLQFHAGLLPGIPCSVQANTYPDCDVDARDAFIVLQVVAGLIDRPPLLFEICDF